MTRESDVSSKKIAEIKGLIRFVLEVTHKDKVTAEVITLADACMQALRELQGIGAEPIRHADPPAL